MASEYSSKAWSSPPKKLMKNNKVCVPTRGLVVASLWEEKFDEFDFINDHLNLLKNTGKVEKIGLKKVSEMLEFI